MNKPSLTLFLLFLLVLGIYPTNVVAEEPLLKLYFIPFSIETFVPTTRETLERSDPIVFMNEHKFIDELLTLLQSHPTGDRVETMKNFRYPRLKADFVNQKAVYFIGQAGTVVREQDGVLFKINKQEMDLLEKRIKDFRGVVDVNASKRFTGK